MNENHEISSHIVRASSTLTSSYVAGIDFSAEDANHLNIVVDYTNGDETTIEVQVESSNDGGTTFARQVSESVSSGTVTVSLSERQFAATGVYSLEIDKVRAKILRISVKATGGTPTGTAAVTAYTSWA